MNSNFFRSARISQLGLSASTYEALQQLADKKRDRELVERAKSRKVPLSYQQRLAQKGA